jgi:hypothetical protein
MKIGIDQRFLQMNGLLMFPCKLHLTYNQTEFSKRMKALPNARL